MMSNATTRLNALGYRTTAYPAVILDDHAFCSAAVTKRASSLGSTSAQQCRMHYLEALSASHVAALDALGMSQEATTVSHSANSSHRSRAYMSSTSTSTSS
jgi:hypothetical protein